MKNDVASLVGRDHRARRNLEQGESSLENGYGARGTARPTSWPRVRLGDVCVTINGIWKGTKIPLKRVGIIRSTNFTKQCEFTLEKTIYIDVEEKKYLSRKLFPGDLIVERSGGGPGQPVGRCVYFDVKDGEYSISNFTSILRIKDTCQTCPRYLQRYLTAIYFQGVTECIQSNATGLHNLDFEAYLNFEIPLPPLPVQREIVARLERELGAAGKLAKKFEELEAAAEAEFKAELKETFEEVSRGGAETRRLGDVCEVVCGKTPLRSNPRFWEGGNMPWFTIDDLREQGNEILTTAKHITDVAVASMRIVPPNTVLLCCTASIGACCIARIPLTTNQQFNALIVRSADLVTAEFLYYFCLGLTPVLMELSSRTTIDFVSKTKVENIDIDIPSLSVQREVVARLDAAKAKKEKLVAAARRGRETAALMRKAILKEAFE